MEETIRNVKATPQRREMLSTAFTSLVPTLLSSFPLADFDGEARRFGGCQRPQDVKSRRRDGVLHLSREVLGGAHSNLEDVKNRFAILGRPVGEREANKAVAGSSLRKEKPVGQQERQRGRGDRQKKKKEERKRERKKEE